MSAWIDTIGMYNEYPQLFDSLVVPDGVDKNTVIDTILFRSSELEILYPNPKFFAYAIGSWASKQLYNWTKLYNTTQLEYNPLENANRTETYTDMEQIGEEGNTQQSLQYNDESETNTGADTTHSVAGYNSSSLVTQSTDEENTDQNYSASGDRSNNTSSTNLRNRVLSHEFKLWGSIGVITPQDLIQKEREVVKFNIYDYIADEFTQRFCLMVY